MVALLLSAAALPIEFFAARDSPNFRLIQASLCSMLFVLVAYVITVWRSRYTNN